MRKTLIVLITLASLPFSFQPALAGSHPPKPLRGGDYWLRNENTWVDWEAKGELAGRLTPRWPSDFEDPGALLQIDWRIDRWPVVRKFVKGEHLKALPDLAGGVIMKDTDGNSWLRVQLEDGQVCFVRANAKFLRPITEVSGQGATSHPMGIRPDPNESPAAPEAAESSSGTR